MRIGHQLGLLGDGVPDLFDTVPDADHDRTARAVEVPAAVGVEEQCAGAPGNNRKVVARGPREDGHRYPASAAPNSSSAVWA
ncbi:hypothetical protein OHA70_22620 [Kribbella sp. NBC_00382]